MTHTLQSYVGGRWISPRSDGVELRHAVTSEVVATAGSDGIDPGELVAYAREVGGPVLRSSTFHERALMLKALVAALQQHKEELYALSAATGATRNDAWIDVDGGLGVLAVYASKARRELPNARHLVDGPSDPLSRDGTFAGLHLMVPREGVDVQINAFNFPCWGSLEKLAPAFLAGVPTIVKPATPTAFVAEALYRRVIEAGILPDGAVQVLCGSPGTLLDHLDGQDSISFTGSSATAEKLRANPIVTRESVRFTAETDSLNAAVLGPGGVSDDADLDRYVAEIVRELATKVGQRCTAIRRALVPEDRVEEVAERIDAELRALRIGDPADERTDVGPLVGLAQREEVRRALAELETGCDVVAGGADLDPALADPRGAFLAPTVLRAGDADFDGVHHIEAFGPVTTLIPYRDTADLLELARRGGGSLVSSIFASDPGFVTEVALGLAPHHGRLLLVDEVSADSQTGHGSPLPHLVHGGPGRAGGGEELGGVRAIHHHLHRVAVQGSPDALTAVAGVYQTGAQRRTDRGHPFRRHLEDLEVGDAIVSDERTITQDDVERFAELTGDRFYAHLDADAAAANPFFDGPVAHGYLVLSAAAGLFVWPDPGPVLANTGLERLRFAAPVYPGDRIRVALTCKRTSLRIDAGYGEVTWDAQVTNQDGELVASYDLLTAVATREGPNTPDGA